MEGVLYYMDPSRNDRIRLVVPVKLREKLLKEVGGTFAGHFAMKGTYEKLNRRYWWNGMYACKGYFSMCSLWGGGKKTRPPL